MKKYAVVVNHGDGKVNLCAYESKAIWSGKNPRGLTYQQMFGNHANVVYETTRKDDAQDFIKKNFDPEEYHFYDLSDQVITGEYLEKKPHRFIKPEAASPINALRNGMIRGYFCGDGEKYMATYEQYFPGEYVLFKIDEDNKQEIEYRSKDADDVMAYLLNQARSCVDKAKNLKEYNLAQGFLNNTLNALTEYERCRRLV